MEVEAVAFFGVPRTVDAKAVKLARLDVANESVPHKCSAFAKIDAVGLFAVGIEETDLDTCGGFRKDGEVCSFFESGGAQRIGLSWQQRSAHGCYDAVSA